MVSNKNQKEDGELQKPLGRPAGIVGGRNEEDLRRYQYQLWKQANPQQQQFECGPNVQRETGFSMAVPEDDPVNSSGQQTLALTGQ